MKKHNYHIVVNCSCSKSSSPNHIYSYGGTKNVCIWVSKNRAELIFSMSVLKTHSDFTTFKLQLFLDAFRKIHLIHVLEYGCGLHVNRLDIHIDGDMRSYEKACSDFPFLYSMLNNATVEFGQSWSNEHIYKCILGSPKSQYERDQRVSSLFSFLASKGKKYELDRFSCLWTSLNAYYSHYAKCFEVLYTSRNPSKTLSIATNDSKSMSALMATYCSGSHLLSKKERNVFRAKFHETERFLSSLMPQEVDELYSVAYNDLINPEKTDNKCILELNELIKPFNQPAFLFLLFEFPYYLRCNFMHGNIATLLFMAYNDKELKMFRLVNAYLDHYLKENIPNIFEPGFLTEDNYISMLSSVSSTNNSAK